MHKVVILNDLKYPIKKTLIISQVQKTLRDQNVKDNTVVNISFVNDKNMTVLHKKYLHEDGTTDVLSFPIDELKSIKSPKIRFKNPDNIIRLGDIVVCFPQAKKQAKEVDATVGEEVNKLVEHGLLHLLGIHHDE